MALKVVIAGASGKNDDLSLFQVTHGLATNVRLNNLLNIEC